jgi:hypothetical protein
MLSRIFICLAVLTVGVAVPIADTADAAPPPKPSGCGPWYPRGVRGPRCWEPDKQPKGADTFKQMYRSPPK